MTAAGTKQQKPNGKGAKKEVKILMLHGECTLS